MPQGDLYAPMGRSDKDLRERVKSLRAYRKDRRRIILRNMLTAVAVCSGSLSLWLNPKRPRDLWIAGVLCAATVVVYGLITTIDLRVRRRSFEVEADPKWSRDPVDDALVQVNASLARTNRMIAALRAKLGI